MRDVPHFILDLYARSLVCSRHMHKSLKLTFNTTKFLDSLYTFLHNAGLSGCNLHGVATHLANAVHNVNDRAKIFVGITKQHISY